MVAYGRWWANVMSYWSLRVLMQFSPPRKKSSQPGSIHLRELLQEEKHHFAIVLTLFSPVPFSRCRLVVVVVPPDDSSSSVSFQMKINQLKAPVLRRKIPARRMILAGLTNHHWSFKTHYQNNSRLRRQHSSLLAVCSYFQEPSNNRQHQQWLCLQHMNHRHLWVQFWCLNRHMRPQLKM